MNKQNIELLFRNYIDNFDYLNDPNGGYETYKWEAIEQVQKAWDLTAPDLSGMIRLAFSKTYNLINNRIVSPGNGLALLAKEDPEAVRKALYDLLMETTDVDEKQDNILRFVDEINALLEKHFPGKWKYTHDLRVAVTYLALINPSQNYLFKSTPAHYFARWMDYDTDLGYGADFKLKFYYQMCDELLAEVNACPELLAKDAERSCDWKDTSNHVLVTDLIYCFGVYPVIRTGLNEPAQRTKKGSKEAQQKERAKRAEELQAKLDQLQDEIDPARIKAVCEHIAKHFMEKINPNGFKAEVVVYDRECCVLYKRELDKLLGEHASTIVMDTNNDKEDKYKEWRRDRDEEARVLDKFKDPKDPLQIVIVTSKLLTGFDAPVLQVMYLDKPMKDHTLLQAICRTNRVFGQEKTYGLIVDYIGIFDDVAKALSFDDEATQTIITNIEALRDKIGELVEKCIAYFPGVDRTRIDWEGLLEAQSRLPDDETRDAFGADYHVLNRVWNALSPDECLTPYREDYRWLSKVYDSIRPGDDSGKLIWAALGSKTLQLVNENISVEQEPVSEESIKLEAELIEKMMDDGDQPKKEAKKLEISLVALIHRHEDDERYIELGKRVEELREKVEAGLLNSIEYLKHLLDIAKEAAEMERRADEIPSEEKGKAALTRLFESTRATSTPVIVERLVNDIDGIVKFVRFPGWKDTTEGRKLIKKSLREVVMVKYKIKDPEVFNKAYGYVEQYY